MARVGLLVECGRDGLEVHVCRRMCELFNEQLSVEIEPVIVPMDHKTRLLEECGTVTRNLLLDDGCDRVVILWDERPAWPNMRDPLCWHNDREKIWAELTQAGIDNQFVHLVCIEREFESWLLFDHPMLSNILSTPARPVRLGRQKSPDRIPNPKGRMMTIFKQHGKRYVDTVYARRLANALTTLNRLRRCPTFCRFAEKVTGINLNR